MAKASNKKRMAKKTAGKKVVKAPAKKAKKVVVKKAAMAKKVQPIVKIINKKVVKKVKKTLAKKTVKPILKKSGKKVVVKKVVTPKKRVIKKQPARKANTKSVLKKAAVKVINKVKAVKPKVLVKKVNPIVKPVKATTKEIIKPKKDRNEFDRKMEQKAQRILKELEERMDISKVKPRISVPLPTPKPKPVPALISLPEPTNTNKEKIQMEFEFRSSRSILFYYLSDPSGLAGWFADDVYEKDHRFTFTWEGSTQTARQVAIQDNTLIRFQWDTEIDGTYFQFEIKEDEITGDIALMITDWGNPGERDSNAKLWESQVLNLKQLIGS